MIFKIFSPKNSAKKLAFLTQNQAKICKILIITLVFEKNANFFAENWQKSPKIVIITSTPGHPDAETKISVCSALKWKPTDPTDPHASHELAKSYFKYNRRSRVRIPPECKV
jgi:hypothetical protein